MSDRVAVMHDGQIVQIDTPEAIYERPRTHYIANFVGRTNLIKVIVRARENNLYRLEACCGAAKTFEVIGNPDSTIKVGDHCLLGTRPEHFHIGDKYTNTRNATVRTVTYFGSVRHVEAEGATGEQFTVVARAGDPIPARGENIVISWRPDAVLSAARGEAEHLKADKLSQQRFLTKVMKRFTVPRRNRRWRQKCGL